MAAAKANVSWRGAALVAAAVALVVAIVVVALKAKPPPDPTTPIRARLELAAGEVSVGSGDKREPAMSGMPLRAGSSISTAAGARALVRLPDGSTTFLRGGTTIALQESVVALESGEYWLDVPPIERDALEHRLGDVSVTATDAGMSLRHADGEARVYVARGMAIMTSPGGRVEVKAGEEATAKGTAAPEVKPVAFWDDWTGGMADFDASGASPGPGTGTIYGVDAGGESGAPAQRLQIKRQAVTATLRDGLSETQVDQTFFNPTGRQLEGWYWFDVPEGASVSGFAVETDGQLVEGEFIEKREAAAQYGVAKATGHAPAILEWVDGRSYRARIFPIPATGTRRVVLRYLELNPIVDGKLTYVYPMGRGASARVGEFSLTADLGELGAKMNVATLDDARIEQNGQRVTMRRSGYTPRVDFQLEARIETERPPLRVSRFATKGEGADYVMARYTPDVDWAKLPIPAANVVVVVDTSADGDEAARQLRATTAEAILRALSQEDRFALASLDVKTQVVHPAEGLVESKDEAISTALERLAEHASGGATDLAALFDASLSRVHGTEQPAVIYVGDGRATSGEMSGEQIIERLRGALAKSRARLFTVGVGERADRALLAELAKAGGGESFAVDQAGEATSRALQLVAAVKVPTITDFELDLGAGLDEPFTNVTGKVPRGSDVILLARTHHDLPREAVVKGRVGGESFEKKVAIVSEESVLTAFVPRLWASAYVRSLLGAAAGPDAERGRIVSLGIEYGLVTPHTSILALESEMAYQRMGIPRKQSPLRGVRLGALSPRQEEGVVGSVHAFGAPEVVFGCNERSAEPAATDAKPQMDEDIREEVEPVTASPAAPPAQATAEPAADDAVAEPEPAAAEAPMEAPMKERAKVAAAPPPLRRPSPATAKPSGGSGLEVNFADKGEMADNELDGKRDVDGIMGGLKGGGRQQGQTRTTVGRWERPPVQVCSDIARRPLAQRAVVWKQRLRTAASAPDLVQRYELARRSCELDDWRSEQVFLVLMQQHIDNPAGATLVLLHFGSRPEVQRFLAKLIVRRTVDEQMVFAVERVLFGSAVDWLEVDRQLAVLETPAERVAKLRELAAREPDDPRGQIRLVEQLAASGDVDQALALGRRLRERGLLTLGIARQLGDVLARASLEEEAVRTYSEIVEFDPDNRASRMLLGDIYLGHGWYEPAYRQYRTVADAAPDEPLAWLRLASAAAGTGRVDEALRLERRVATAQGRPGPQDPRRWARLASAARVAELLAKGDETTPKSSLERKLKELSLFGSGTGSLVILTWEDLRADLALTTLVDDTPALLGDAVDASPMGLSAVQLSSDELAKAALVANLRSLPLKDATAVVRHDITWDGKAFQVAVSRHELAARASKLAL